MSELQFPLHKCGLYLTHNEHRDYYQSAKDYVYEWGGHIAQPDWKDEEAKQRAIATDEIWTLQWYPHTPIGFQLDRRSDIAGVARFR